MNSIYFDLKIIALILALMLLEYFVFRKLKTWMHVAFWSIGGFLFTYYFSRG